MYAPVELPCWGGTSHPGLYWVVGWDGVVCVPAGVQVCVGRWGPGKGDQSLLLGSPCVWKDPVAAQVIESLNLRLTLWAFTPGSPVMRTCSHHVDVPSTPFSPDFYSSFSYQR